MVTIKNQLNKNGYQIPSPQEKLKFEGEFKEVFVKFQKENQLPYGSINVKTLNSLGINVKEKND